MKRNYKKFLLAIVWQAVDDLQKARRQYNEAVAKGRVKRAKNLEYIIEECENFFKSPLCKQLCGVEGTKILKKLDEEHVEIPLNVF